MIPGSDPLDREVERLIARCRPYVDVTGAIYRIRALQHDATVGSAACRELTREGERLGLYQPPATHGDPQVFDLEAFRTRHEAGCYQDDDGPEAA